MTAPLRNRGLWLAVVIMGPGVAAGLAAEPPKPKKEPIFISFMTHQENAYIRGIPRQEGRNWTAGPRGYATRAKELIEGWEKHGIKGEYSTMGVALQQLADEYPDVIETIKRLKIPVTRYGGVGHAEPCAVGRLGDLGGMTMDEALRAIWEFETRTLAPNWRLENGRVVIGNPRAGQPITLEELPLYNLPQKETWLYGGTLALEMLLGVIPMDFFQARYQNLGRDEEASAWPLNAVKRALGMGSYPVSMNPGRPHRIGRLPPQLVAANWPRHVPYYMLGGVALGNIQALLSNPGDYRIVWPDPEANQWKPENSALEFFKRTYGVSSFKQVLQMECPLNTIKGLMTPEEKERFQRMLDRFTRKKKAVAEAGAAGWETRLLKEEELREWPEHLMALFEERRDLPAHLRPRQTTLSRENLFAAAQDLLIHWPVSNHDGDFGGPPDYVRAGSTTLSLAETFEALAFALESFVVSERIPEKIVIDEILGPIDYPVYRLKVEPKLDPEKMIGIAGWQPYELDSAHFPDPELVRRQGLNPPSFAPLSVSANEVSVMQAAVAAARRIRENGHVPGSIEIFLPARAAQPGERAPETLMYANSAELLYGMAQVYYLLVRDGMPGPVRMASVKIIEDQICRYVVHSGPASYMGGRFQAEWMNTGFIWRAWVPVWRLNAAWSHKPASR